MKYIIGILATFLGMIMNGFFEVLTYIGYPRLWACIVLYAVFTRFFFLPRKINNCKKTVLNPVVRRELYLLNPAYIKKTKDKVLLKEIKKQTKIINKKYGLSNRSGWMVTFIQYPLLVALLYVVKNPQKYIPLLEELTVVAANSVNFLGVSLDTIPLNSLHVSDMRYLAVIVPVIVMLFTFLKLFHSLKLAQKAAIKQRNKVYILCLISLALLGWFSVKLPIVVSLYWITNDVVFFVFDFFIQKFVPKNKKIVALLDEHQVLMAEMKRQASSQAASQIQN